jgi:hypothetical protein
MPASPPVCDQLIVARELLHRIMPLPSEVSLLCHARQANLEDQEVKGDEDGFYAVVIANRLPKPGASVRVCLVSLEGQPGSIWPTGKALESSGASSETTHLTFTSFHRFIVLWSWTYLTGAGGDFQELMADIVERQQARPFAAAGSPGTRSAGTFRLDSHANGDVVPVSYHGPLLPSWPGRWTPPAPSSEEGEAVGYESAMELGRLLTLGRSDVLSALIEFREAPMRETVDATLADRLASGAQEPLASRIRAQKIKAPEQIRQVLRTSPVTALQGQMQSVLHMADPSGVKHLASLLAAKGATSSGTSGASSSGSSGSSASTMAKTVPLSTTSSTPATVSPSGLKLVVPASKGNPIDADAAALDQEFGFLVPASTEVMGG